MSATWIAIAAPYVPEIIKLARPLFTRTPVVADNTQQIRLDVVSEQITELQNAASQNADSIRKLATVATTAAVLAFGVAAYALAN